MENHRKQRQIQHSVAVFYLSGKKYSRLRAVGVHASERREPPAAPALGEKSEIVCFPWLSSA